MSVYSQDYSIFLECLRQARRRSGISQRELAQRLDKSASYVAKVETGYNRMDIHQIRCYLDAVEIPFLEFMQQFEEAVQQKLKT